MPTATLYLGKEWRCKFLSAETARFETYSFSTPIGSSATANSAQSGFKSRTEAPLRFLSPGKNHTAIFVAETARFELARVLPLLAFQASALGHYATSPLYKGMHTMHMPCYDTRPLTYCNTILVLVKRNRNIRY